MAERKSLLDDASFNAIGAKGAASGGARGADRKKLILAIVGLVMAGGMLGYFQVLRPNLERDRGDRDESRADARGTAIGG